MANSNHLSQNANLVTKSLLMKRKPENVGKLLLHVEKNVE